MGDEQEANDKKANVWVLLPVVVVFVLHFAFFLTWIALATMFDFAYSLEIICLLVVMLFHLFMSVKLVLKIVRRIKGMRALPFPSHIPHSLWCAFLTHCGIRRELRRQRRGGAKRSSPRTRRDRLR